MVSLLLELCLCLSLGALLEWKLPWLPSQLAQPLIRWGVPLSLAALLLRSQFSYALLRVGLLGLVVPLVSLMVLWFSPMRRRIPDRMLRLGAAVGNTGYWGLPVAVALLPPESVASAAVYDVAGTLFTWSVGPLVLLGVPSSLARLFTLLLASPALQGILLAACLSQTPWRLALAQALWWPARGVFVVALALLGMRLGHTIREGPVVLVPAIVWALAFKLLAVPALAWLFGRLLLLPPMDREALVLQGAAPTALSVMLMAEAQQEAIPLASSLVLGSTFTALLSVPLWWGLIH